MDVGLVCDSCSTFNPMGTKDCTRCGDALSLDTPRVLGDSPHEVTRVDLNIKLPARVPCPECGGMVTAGHRFCGQCGATMDGSSKEAPIIPKPKSTAPIKHASKNSGARPVRRTAFFGAMQASRAKLVIIRGDGQDGMSYNLAGDEHVVGRSPDAAIQFDGDPFISPMHANFFYDAGNLMVRDEGSINGVYVRIKGTVPIEYGTSFLVGEQLLAVREPPSSLGPVAMDDGTYYFTSPPKPAFYRIAQLLEGGDVGMLYLAYRPSIDIGREENDINFPNDPFISGAHARISLEGEQLRLTDLNSKNGTFLRVHGDHALHHGDYVFMGQQLLRVEIV